MSLTSGDKFILKVQPSKPTHKRATDTPLCGPTPNRAWPRAELLTSREHEGGARERARERIPKQ